MIYATFGLFRAAVKRESRLESGTDFDTLILDIANELQYQLCLKNRFGELFVADSEVSIVADGDSTITIPANLLVLEKDSVYFYRDNLKRPLTPATYPQDRIKYSTIGSPAMHALVGRTMYFWPFDQTLTTDKIVLSYYKEPTAFVNDASTFDVPTIQPQLKLLVIARLAVYHGKVDHAGAFTTLAKQAYIDSR